VRSETDSHVVDETKTGNNSKRLFKSIGLSLVAIVIFLFGMGVGNGRLVIGGSSKNTASNKDLPADLDYATVEQVYDLLKTNYDGKLDASKLVDGLKGGLAKATGDPYTQYFSVAEAKKFNEELNGSFSGIGAQLGQDNDGNIQIVAPIDGFPASKAGIRPQDLVISIDGTSTTDMSVDEAVSKIRGKKGTQVTLGILRDKKENLKVTITRDDITIPSVKWEVVNDNVGYITVSQFSEDTAKLMEQAATQLKNDGVKSIVLDLRGNPGGLLTAAVTMASQWLPEGKTVLQEKRGGIVSNTYTSETKGDNAPFKGLPTAVLVNAGSASASEIVAGALRDNNVATIIGEKSYGKGSVQEINNLPNGSEIKITVARWYRPNGQNIDKKGISPDKEVKMSDDDYKQNKDPQKDAALEFVKQK
jgi:carboxyl-terminal processing protease